MSPSEDTAPGEGPEDTHPHTKPCACGRAQAPLYLLLQLHTDGVGLLQVHSIAPEQISEGRELVTLPLPEGPLGQLELVLSPRDFFLLFFLFGCL